MTTKPTATARRTAKNNMFILTNNNLRVHHAILHISLPSLHHYDMRRPNFTSPLYGVGERNTLRACLRGVGDPGLVGLVSFVFMLWGTQNKRNLSH